MRIQNSIKNMKISFIFFSVTIILNFISRSIFIKYLGAEIVGYNNLVNSLLGFLNMAELGVSAAIAYSLYEPLKNKDFRKINEIMSLFKYLYKNIGIVVIIGGILISFVLPFFLKNQIALSKAYIYFYLLLLANGIGYFFTYKQVLLVSDQKQYIVTLISSLIKVIKGIIQIILLIFLKSYLLWIIIEFVSNLLSYIIINKKVDREYSNINFNQKTSFNKLKENNLSIIKDIKNIFFHKISSFVVYQTDSILISAFASLTETAIYANYMMIINNIISLINNVTSGITASIGNLISEKDEEKNYDIFKKLHLFDNFLALFISFVLYKTINNFIEIWVGKQFLFTNKIVIILILNLYFQISRGTIVKFKTAFGLFWDIWAPLVEGVINLILSIYFANKFGIIGIFVGTIFSNIVIVVVWHPIMVFKYGFKKNVLNYYIYTLKIILLGCLSMFITNELLNFFIINFQSQSFISFIVKSFIFACISIIIMSLIFCIIKEFRELIKTIFNNVILNKFNKYKCKH